MDTKLPPSLKSLIPLPPVLHSLSNSPGDLNKGLPSTHAARCCQVHLYFPSHQRLFWLRTFNGHHCPLARFCCWLSGPSPHEAPPPRQPHLPSHSLSSSQRARYRLLGLSLARVLFLPILTFSPDKI